MSESNRSPAEDHDMEELSSGSDSDLSSPSRVGCGSNEDEDLALLVAESQAPLNSAAYSYAPPRPRRFALHDAAEKGDVETIKRLLASPEPNEFLTSAPQADVDERDREGCTALHIALIHAQLEATKVLLDHGAEVLFRVEGSSPMHMAVSAGCMPRERHFAHQAVELLMQYDADINLVDSLGRTPLHLAAAFDLPECVQALSKAVGFGSLNVRDAAGDTPLHVACRRGSASCVQHLLALGAEVLLPNKRGLTPLHMAAIAGFEAGISLLLSHVPKTSSSPSSASSSSSSASAASSDPCAVASAQLHSKDQRGWTPVQWALKRRHMGAVALLNGSEASASASVSASASSSNDQKHNDSNTNGLSSLTRKPTLFVNHPICVRHLTARSVSRQASEPPPENVKRLQVLVNEKYGILHASEFDKQKVEWHMQPPRAAISDVLRVHEFSYVRNLIKRCDEIPEGEIDELDNDTCISARSMDSALTAAGAVTMAIDRVMSGHNRNAFCAVRPPGHHAGPTGIVYSELDSHGTHGFCLLNNVAIGASYAMNVYRHQGVKRVAILDFDVHHGNGTEAILRNLTPHYVSHKVSTPFTEGTLRTLSYKPWLGDDDKHHVLFASVHGFGNEGMDAGYFYPASGETNMPFDDQKGATQLFNNNHNNNNNTTASNNINNNSDSTAAESERHSSLGPGPHIFNVGIGNRLPARVWRQAWRDVILPRVVAHQPDLILISAGFDGHRRDGINMGYIGLDEWDYEWLTQEIVAVANRVCHGRVVSVLEGGYQVQGRLVSPFARSVACHTRALVEQHDQVYEEGDAAWEREREVAEMKAAEAARAERERLEAERRRQIQRQREAEMAPVEMPPEQPSLAQQLAEANASSAQTPDFIVSPTNSSSSVASASSASSASSDPSSASSAVSSTASSAAAPSSEEGRSKRRRGPVPDYKALNEQMERELAEKRARKA